MIIISIHPTLSFIRTAVVDYCHEFNPSDRWITFTFHVHVKARRPESSLRAFSSFFLLSPSSVKIEFAWLSGAQFASLECLLAQGLSGRPAGREGDLLFNGPWTLFKLLIGDDKVGQSRSMKLISPWYRGGTGSVKFFRGGHGIHLNIWSPLIISWPLKSPT